MQGLINHIPGRICDHKTVYEADFYIRLLPSNDHKRNNRETVGSGDLYVVGVKLGQVRRMESPAVVTRRRLWTT
jgi:hypothetical protein